MSHKEHLPSSAASVGERGILRAAEHALEERERAALKAAQGSRVARGCSAIVSLATIPIGLIFGGVAVEGLRRGNLGLALSMLPLALLFGSGGLWLTMRWARGLSPIGDPIEGALPPPTSMTNDAPAPTRPASPAEHDRAEPRGPNTATF